MDLTREEVVAVMSDDTRREYFVRDFLDKVELIEIITPPGPDLATVRALDTQEKLVLWAPGFREKMTECKQEGREKTISLVTVSGQDLLVIRPQNPNGVKDSIAKAHEMSDARRQEIAKSNGNLKNGISLAIEPEPRAAALQNLPGRQIDLDAIGPYRRLHSIVFVTSTLLLLQNSGLIFISNIMRRKPVTRITTSMLVMKAEDSVKLATTLGGVALLMGLIFKIDAGLNLIARFRTFPIRMTASSILALGWFLSRYVETYLVHYDLIRTPLDAFVLFTHATTVPAIILLITMFATRPYASPRAARSALQTAVAQLPAIPATAQKSAATTTDDIVANSDNIINGIEDNSVTPSEIQTEDEAIQTRNAEEILEAAERRMGPIQTSEEEPGPYRARSGTLVNISRRNRSQNNMLRLSSATVDLVTKKLEKVASNEQGAQESASAETEADEDAVPLSDITNLDKATAKK